eukprot:2808929-Rhodomonas_salina.1
MIKSRPSSESKSDVTYWISSHSAGCDGSGTHHGADCACTRYGSALSASRKRCPYSAPYSGLWSPGAQ